MDAFENDVLGGRVVGAEEADFQCVLAVPEGRAGCWEQDFHAVVDALDYAAWVGLEGVAVEVHLGPAVEGDVGGFPGEVVAVERDGQGVVLGEAMESQT